MTETLSLRRLLLSASLTMALLTLLLALVLLALDLQSALERRRSVHDALLDTFTSVYLQAKLDRNLTLLDTVSAGLPLASVRAGEPVQPLTWAPLLGMIKGEGEHAYFYNLRSEHLDVYPEWTQPAGFVATERPWAALLNPQRAGETDWIGPYPEFSSHKQVMMIVRRVRDDDGTLLGLLMVDLEIASIKQALERAVGSTPTTMLVYGRDGQIIAAANPQHLPLVPGQLQQADASANLLPALLHGVIVYRRLS
ncbi:MAG: cache domain-containing protein, partial [Plesiomonas shigelloides]